ncbi:MAG: HupE/UreJ family protein [Gemmatimonadetes bacterium]|nr:HupE/UreJ family protein [Gemmatimonadota bacterium]MYG85627.1 HupE/UreJ family protein [Gemmatimonadota bacterium]MYJ91414.1 HupE/UreJ family protein [Gemmatimonadota bacterium]
MALCFPVGTTDRVSPLTGRRAATGRVAVRVLLSLAIAGLTAAVPSTGAFGHDIPTDITVRAFIKPEDQRLRMLVRVPLEAMLDVTFPLTGPGYLDLSRADEFLRDAAMLWLGQEVSIYENGTRLAVPELVAVRASLPSDPSFHAYDTALASTRGPPLPVGTQIFWQQVMLDVLFEYRITSDRSEFSILPGLERLGMRVSTVLRFLPVSGGERLYQYTGNPGRVVLDPRWHQAAFRFVQLGFTHILDGMDHLLFLLCLIIPFQRLRVLVVLVTAFTVAHSVTLVAATLGLTPAALWFVPLVETVIAASIVYMALENIVSPGLRRRWMAVFGFGLVHGFGFAYALRDMLPFGGDHLVVSLLAFNVGVEIGQLLVILVCVPVLRMLFRYLPGEQTGQSEQTGGTGQSEQTGGTGWSGQPRRIGAVILSVLAGHTAWHWLVERGAVLWEFDVLATTPDGALYGVLGLLVLMLIIAALAGWAFLRSDRTGWLDRTVRTDRTDQKDQANRVLE